MHAHDLYLVGGALRGGRQLGVKVIADLYENWVAALKHYTWSNRFPAKMIINLNRWDRLESAQSSAADGVMVVIEEMVERPRNKGISQSNMIVLPNTIHRAHFDAFGINRSLSDSVESDLTLLYTGGMDWHRSIDTAIRAMPTILTSVPTARLILVGDGAARRELEERSNQLALGDSFQFLGWQPQETIPSYIAGADIRLIPHLKTEQWDHTIPHKLFHNMHLGVPVVVSNCKPFERILQDSDSGLIHLSGNPEDLARAVISLAENPSIRSEKGENGRRSVATRYNWEMTSSGLATFYRKLLV